VLVPVRVSFVFSIPAVCVCPKRGHSTNNNTSVIVLDGIDDKTVVGRVMPSIPSA